MAYFVADSYKGFQLVGEPFYNKSGKLASMAECKCDRCHKGVYVCRVENGQPVPHPAYGGVCLKCGGSGIIRKEVRLYTESEYNSMQKAKDRAREKKDEEMRAAASEKQKLWLKQHGFNEEGVTYIVKGETYSIKEQLKADGFRFDSILMWHQSEVPAGYEDKVVSFNCNNLIEFSAWGDGHFIESAQKIVREAVQPEEEQPNSEWLEGEKFSDLLVTFTKKSGFSGRFGWTNVFTFQTEEENVLTWFTSTEPEIKLGDSFFLSGKIKNRTEYKGLKQTVVTRCRIS